MIRGSEPSYEVHVNRDGRWTIEAVESSRATAQNAAQALGGSGRFSAVRVVETRGEGTRDKTVFEMACDVAQPVLAIAPVDDAPLCEKVGDYYGYPARRTAGRLLREFLDQRGITAFEFVHDYASLREFGRLDDFVTQAIHRISRIQGRVGGVKPGDRFDALSLALRELTRRAKTLDGLDVHVAALKAGGVPAARRSLEAAGDPKRVPRLLAATMARYLAEARDPLPKLDLVLGLAALDQSPATVGLVDELAAEILDGATALQQLLGNQRHLGSALTTIAALSGGTVRLGDRGKEATIGRVNDLLGRFALPLTQEVLVERVAAGLRGVQPLTREGRDADIKAFVRILQGITAHGGLRGGQPMSEAVTRRARLVFGDYGRDLSAADGLGRVLALLPSAAVRLGYLLDLSATEFGNANQTAVLRALQEVVQGLSSLRDLVAAGAGPDGLVKAVDELNARLAGGLLPADVADLIRQRLARLAQAAPSEPTLAEPTSGPAVEPGVDGVLRKFFPAGSYIFRQGEPGDEAYLVDSGAIDIVVERETRERIIATVRRGEIIGEMALVDSKPRVASARVRSDAVLVVISEEDFRARLDRIAEADRLILMLLTRYVERLRAHATAI